MTRDLVEQPCNNMFCYNFVLRHAGVAAHDDECPLAGAAAIYYLKFRALSTISATADIFQKGHFFCLVRRGAARMCAAAAAAAAAAAEAAAAATRQIIMAREKKFT